MPHGKTLEMIAISKAFRWRTVKPKEKVERDRTLNGKTRRRWRKGLLY